MPAADAKRRTGEQVIRVRTGKSEYLISFGVAFAEAGRMFGLVVNEAALLDP